MNISTKLGLIMILGMVTRIYCAEEKRNPSKTPAIGIPMPHATVNQLTQKERDILKQQSFDRAKASIDDHISNLLPVPMKYIAMADQATAALAMKHNTNLLQQKIQNQK